MAETYSDLLKDIRWLEKRKKILERDDYHCVSCINKDGGDLGKHLEVHHLFYKKGLLPWEYDDEDLITLCDNCHDFISKKIASCNELIGRMCIDDDYAEQLESVLQALSKIKNPWRVHDVSNMIKIVSGEIIPIRTMMMKNFKRINADGI